MKTSTRFLIATVASGAFLASTHASVIAFDSFDYADGNLAGNNGGTGWGGNAWLAPANANLFATVAGGEVTTGWSTANANAPSAPRQLAVPLTSTFYVGYQFRYENTGAGAFDNSNTFSFHLSDTAANTSSLNFGIRHSGTVTDVSNSNNFMVRSGTGGITDINQGTGGFIVPDADYTMVARVTYSGSNFDMIEAWLNPTLTDDVDTPTGDIRLSLTAGTGLASISHIFARVAANQADDRYIFDNVVLGTEWGDVITAVPEPASGGLMLLGGVAMLLIRRRCRA